MHAQPNGLWFPNPFRPLLAYNNERLCTGRPEPISIESLGQLSGALVQARIVAGLSQKELADRLGLKEQQIQRYEATDYGSASLTRLKEVAEALGATITGEMTCAR